MTLDVDWNVVVYNLYHLGIAFALAMPVALDREKKSRSAGLRTFPLVAMAACGYALVGASILSTTGAEARVLQGIITGIGFIGGGAILKSGSSVRGTATAASIWNMGIIGIAVAFDRYEIALLLSVFNFAVLRLTPNLSSDSKDDDG